MKEKAYANGRRRRRAQLKKAFRQARVVNVRVCNSSIRRRGQAGGGVRMRLVRLVVCAREREREKERAASQTNVVDDIDAAKPASASASHTQNSLILFAS